MTYKLKISKQNQVTIPVAILKELNLSSGGYLHIKSEQEDFKILNDKAKIHKFAGSLGRKIKDKNKLGLSDEELEMAIKKAKFDYFKNTKNIAHNL